MTSFHIGKLDPPLERIPENHAALAESLRTIADRLERGEVLAGRWSISEVRPRPGEHGEDLQIELMLYTRR